VQGGRTRRAGGVLHRRVEHWSRAILSCHRDTASSITRHSPSAYAAYTSHVHPTPVQDTPTSALEVPRHIALAQLGPRGQGRACTKSLDQSKCKADPATSSGSVALGVLVHEDAAVWIQPWSQTCRGRKGTDGLDSELESVRI
jgi:hypothetical protein